MSQLEPPRTTRPKPKATQRSRTNTVLLLQRLSSLNPARRASARKSQTSDVCRRSQVRLKCGRELKEFLPGHQRLGTSSATRVAGRTKATDSWSGPAGRNERVMRSSANATVSRFTRSHFFRRVKSWRSIGEASAIIQLTRLRATYPPRPRRSYAGNLGLRRSSATRYASNGLPELIRLPRSSKPSGSPGGLSTRHARITGAGHAQPATREGDWRRGQRPLRRTRMAPPGKDGLRCGEGCGSREQVTHYPRTSVLGAQTHKLVPLS